MSDLVAQKTLAPVVHTTADPDAELLLQMRAIISKDQQLTELFERFRKESLSVEWLRDQVATSIAVHITVECTFDDVVAACQYLADEYNQLGEGYFMVSTETGRVEAVITEDDLYDPGLITRHSGEMAPALRRMKPGVETMLLSYKHEKAREEQALAILKEKYPQTALLRDEGDNRFRMVTRAGRKAISKDLQGDDPRELLRRASGTSGMFLRHFPLVEEAPADLSGYAVLQGTAAFRSRTMVQDPLTLNIGHNRLGTLRAAAPQGWVRAICRSLAEETHTRKRALPVQVEDLSFADLDHVELWVADPDSYKEMLAVHPAVKAVPVDGASPIGLTGEVGYLTLDHEAFSVESKELSGRWEVVANVPYTLYVNWDKVRALPLVGVSHEATTV